MCETKETFGEVIQEYIAFINSQVGMYMDALAGFEGHHTRVEQQLSKVLRPTQKSFDPQTQSDVVVWASYEDPSRPNVIHNRIIRADDYIAVNARGGSNEVQHARSVLVFLFTFWESEIRPRLAAATEVEVDQIASDVMGDLRLIRHAILHTRGVLRMEAHRKLKVLSQMFLPGEPIRPGFDEMRRLFEVTKQECARLCLAWMKAPQQILDLLRDVAVLQVRR